MKLIELILRGQQAEEDGDQEALDRIARQLYRKSQNARDSECIATLRYVLSLTDEFDCDSLFFGWGDWLRSFLLALFLKKGYKG